MAKRLQTETCHFLAAVIQHLMSKTCKSCRNTVAQKLMLGAQMGLTLKGSECYSEIGIRLRKHSPEFM